MKEYIVKNIGKHLFNTNGQRNLEIWNKAHVLTDFLSPWPINKTVENIEFRALTNNKTLCCQFKVFDTNIHIDKSEIILDSINNSDRVELFFRNSPSLNPYYCLEIDPSTRIMDFMAKPNKQFDFNWIWSKTNIKVKSYILPDYFTVEIALDLLYLKTLNVLKGNKIETGIYRAKYHEQQNGTFKPEWITWVNPNTKTPNFHTPSSFGILRLESF
ncbi:MAG: sugar-binding protein [Aestuariibaculum sp.]